MGTTLAIRFPLGQYHATPWERSVNEGAVEWPPSLWRMLRALIATWYTRWPDLPAAAFDGLLDALADPPSYYTPTSMPAHTRHYLPDLDHKKGEQGGTDLTLDPFLSVATDETLLIRWDVSLDSEQRSILAKLAELMPYLGRAESVCEARLLDDDPVPDERWWRPDCEGRQRTRLLCPVRPLSRAALEISTVEVRRQRRTMPPGTTWIDYARSEPARVVRSAKPEPPPVEAIRYAVMGQGRVPFKSVNAVLLADDAHRVIGERLAKATKETGGQAASLLGTNGAETDHSHAHWVPIANSHQHGASVQSLVLWVPRGLTAAEVAKIVSLPTFSGHRGGGRGNGGYEFHGFPEVSLVFQAAGPIGQVAPELCGPARIWRSLTPYLPVRHRKRKSLDQYLTADIAAEFAYRERLHRVPPPKVTAIEGHERLPDRWASEFRRYRLAERINMSRPGLGLRLEFAEPVAGPLLLGQLSHFGYGIFVPETSCR
jgi:CRISPR-associated protein Csb2